MLNLQQIIHIILSVNRVQKIRNKEAYKSISIDL